MSVFGLRESTRSFEGTCSTKCCSYILYLPTYNKHWIYSHLNLHRCACTTSWIRRRLIGGWTFFLLLHENRNTYRQPAYTVTVYIEQDSPMVALNACLFPFCSILSLPSLFAIVAPDNLYTFAKKGRRWNLHYEAGKTTREPAASSIFIYWWPRRQMERDTRGS